MLVGNKDSELVQRFFQDVQKSGQTAQEFLKSNSNYFGDMSQSLQDCVTSSSSYGEAIGRMGTQIVSTTAKMIAFRAAAVALNAVTTALVSGAISWGLSKLDDFLHQADRIKEAATTAKTSIQDIKSSYQDKTNTVNDNLDKFVQLSKGVDSLTGKNIGLSAESYQEFLDISNQLAEAFPSLSRTYDENGNAIVNLGTNADQAREQLQSLLEVERQLANQEIASNLGDVFKGVEYEHVKNMNEISTYQNQIEAAQSQMAKTANSFEWDANLLKIDDSLFTDGKGNVDTVALEGFKNQVKDGLDELGIAYNEVLGENEFVLDWGQLSSDQRAKQQRQIQDYFTIDTETLRQSVATSKQRINELKEANKQNWAGLIDSLDTWVETDSKFSSMSDSMKSLTQKMIGNIDFSELYESGDYSSIEDYQKYIQNKIVDPIKSLSESNQLKLSDLFNLDTSDTSIDDYINEINSTINDIAADSDFTAKELFDLTGLGTVKDEYKKAGKELKSLLKDADEHELELGNLSVDDTLAAIDAIKERGIDTWAELNALFNSGVLKPDIDISAETEAIKSLYEAIGNSNGATGLTADDISAIKSRYKDLDSYDYSKVFQKTSTGVHANTKALQELEDEYNNLQKAHQQAKLDDLIARYDQLSQKMQEAQGDPIKYGQLSAQRDSILNEINNCSELIAQYNGLTSAYNKWLQAKSTGNNRDKYENISSSYSDAEKTVKEGWFADDDLNTYLDLVLSAKQRTGDAEKDFAKLKKTIGDTGYSIWSFLRPDDSGNLTSDGLYDMLNCVYALDDSLVKISGNEYSFDWSGEKLQQVADMLGMSTEAVQILEEALQDTGANVVFDSMFTNVERLNKGLDGTVEKLKEMAGNGKLQDINGNAIDVDLSSITGKASTVKEAADQMEILRSVLNEMKDNGKLDISCEGASEALETYSALAQQKAILENPTIMEFDCNADGVEAGVSEAMSLLQEFVNATTAVEIMAEMGLDTSEAEANVDSILAKMSESETITADMNINTDSAKSALNSIKENDAEIQKTLNVDTSEAKSQIEEATGGGGPLEKQVKLNVDASEIANIQSQIDVIEAKIPVSFNVVGQSIESLIASATANTPSIPVTFTAESSEVDNYAATKKSGSGVVKWSNNSGAVDSYAATRKSASGTVNWGNNTSAVKTHFTATGTVNWSNANGPGNAQGTAHARGSAYARGYWGVRQDENALVGEMGRKNCAPAQ